jgi:hypothetical protein
MSITYQAPTYNAATNSYNIEDGPLYVASHGIGAITPCLPGTALWTWHAVDYPFADAEEAVLRGSQSAPFGDRAYALRQYHAMNLIVRNSGSSRFRLKPLPGEAGVDNGSGMQSTADDAQYEIVLPEDTDAEHADTTYSLYKTSATQDGAGFPDQRTHIQVPTANVKIRASWRGPRGTPSTYSLLQIAIPSTAESSEEGSTGSKRVYSLHPTGWTGLEVSGQADSSEMSHAKPTISGRELVDGLMWAKLADGETWPDLAELTRPRSLPRTQVEFCLRSLGHDSID